jgi:PAS domain S-box-containing protein
MAKIIPLNKKAGQLFQDSTENLSDLLDSLPVCISYFDKEQRFQFNNKTYEEWLGISQRDLKGKHIREVIGKKVYESVRGHIEKALSGEKVTYNTELIKKDGATRFVKVNVMPHIEDNGDVTGCYVHVEDISDNVLLNAELQEKLKFEQLLSKLSARFVNLPASDVDTNINDGLQLVNELVDVDEIYILQFQSGKGTAGITHGWFKSGIVRELEFKASEFIHVLPWAGRKIIENEIIVFERMEDELPVEAVNEREYLRQIGLESAVVIPLFAGKKNLGAFFIETLGRQKKWSREVVSQLSLIGELFSSALERKNTAEILADSQERLSAFMDYSPAYMYIKDSSGKHLFANRAFLKSLNSTLDQFIGTGSYDFLPDSVAKKIEAFDREIIEKGHPIETEEINTTLTGKSIHFKDIKFPVKLYSGEVGVGGIVIDITDIKQKENNLQKAYDEIKILKDRLEVENVYLRDQISVQSTHEDIIGKSDAIQYVLYKIKQVAPSDTTVLILGETGTGKELVAEAIKNESSRRNRPLVKVNCAALPSNLIESELFGREKGAFTGSMAKQIGRFELADKGTIFLDEIGELPIEIQAKLLRIIQSGEFERLGSPHTVKVDVRIIASTNRDLIDEVKKGKFREDLFYRLNVFPLTVPPLRKRKEDIPIIVNYFLKKFSKKIGKKIERVPYDVIKSLQEYHWPGNVRELENIIERSMITSPKSTLHLADKLGPSDTTDHGTSQSKSLSDMERNHIFRILDQTRWKIEGRNGAAEILKLNPSTLRSRIRKLGITKQGERN